MNPVSRTSRRLRTLAAVAAATVAVLPAGNAFAAEKAPARPAVLAPMLDFFTFGAGLGVPLGCALTLSYVQDGAGVFGQGAAVDPLISGGNDACTQFGMQSTEYIEQGRVQAAPLAAINPYVNPAIADFAEAVRSFGTDYAALISPFGPFVAGSGDTIDFFQGG